MGKRDYVKITEAIYHFCPYWCYLNRKKVSQSWPQPVTNHQIIGSLASASSLEAFLISPSFIFLSSTSRAIVLVIPQHRPATSNLQSFQNKFAKPNSCTYICNRLVAQKTRQYETGYFSGDSRPYKEGNHNLNCTTGNDTECHCRKLPHHTTSCF